MPVSSIFDYLHSFNTLSAVPSSPDGVPPYLLAFFAAMAGGAINTVAGGGTLLTFPVLIFGLGLDPIAASATNSMALWPAALTGALGFKRSAADVNAFLIPFAAISVLGAVVGAVLLFFTPLEQFKAIVPWLILMAVALFLLQERLQSRLGPPLSAEAALEPCKAPTAAALLFQFCVAVYGGYFGAGIGILMLAVLGFMRVGDIYRMSYIKNVCALIINFAAAITLAWRGLIVWPVALVMVLGACLGGYAGADVAKKIGAKNLRQAISVIGLLLAGYMIFKQVAA